MAQIGLAQPGSASKLFAVVYVGVIEFWCHGVGNSSVATGCSDDGGSGRVGGCNANVKQEIRPSFKRRGCRECHQHTAFRFRKDIYNMVLRK